MLALSPDGVTVRLPALATAHSHAFQFAMRGTSQRRGKDPKDDFWTWRASRTDIGASGSPWAPRHRCAPRGRLV